jgi:hypothetical protein
VLNGERTRSLDTIVHPVWPLELRNTLGQFKPARADNPKGASAILFVFAFFNQQRLIDSGIPIVAGMIGEGLKHSVNVPGKNPFNVNAKHSYS